jgi:hypothetical protein
VELSIYLKSHDAWGRLEEIEKWPDITGMFTLKFDEKDVVAQIRNSEDGRLAMNENRMKIDGLPDYFHKPAKIDLGLIQFRYVRPYVRVIYKEDGKCYLGSVTLKEDYLGGGKYGPLKYHKFWGEEGLLDCALIK